MIRAMRRQSPRFLALAALCTAYVATAQVVISNVPEPVAVTFPEVKVFVYVTLAAVLTTVVLITGSIAAFVLSRDHTADTEARAALAAAIVADHKVREEQFAALRAVVESVGDSVKALAAVIKEHTDAPFPHPAAVHEANKELGDRMTALKDELDEHVAYCRTHGCAFGRRDPADSPSPRRAEDPEPFDGRPLRGRQ